MWREGYVPGGDTRFWVRAMGHGDDLVLLLHGWPEDGSMWRRVAPLVVEAGYRVACPDLKGFGRSEAPSRGYDAETLADEISQLIRNLHAKKAVLVGHDWGGAVALATAFRHPGRVRALVLASAPYRQLDLGKAWHIPLMNVPVLPELAFGRLPGPLVRTAIRHAAVRHEPFTDEVLDGYTAAISAAPGAWVRYYRSLSRRALVDWTMRTARRRLPFLPEPAHGHRLRVPTTVIWGEEDPVAPVALGSRVAHDLDAEFVTIPGVGHFVPEEDPLAFARVLLERIGRAPGTPRRRLGLSRPVTSPSPPRLPDAVVFDCDGTIVDTEPISDRTWVEILGRRGYTPTPADTAAVIGRPFPHTHAYYSARVDGLGDLHELRREVRAVFRTIFDEEVVAFDDAVATIRELAGAGVPVAVASSSSRRHVEKVVAFCELGSFVAVMLGADDTDDHKPHPAPYLAAARRLGVPAERCSAVEDSPAGIASAKAARMFTVAVRRGHVDDAGLAGADRVVDEVTVAALVR